LLPNVFLVNFKYNNNHLTEINFILHFLTKYYYSYFFISTILFLTSKKSQRTRHRSHSISGRRFCSRSYSDLAPFTAPISISVRSSSPHSSFFSVNCCCSFSIPIAIVILRWISMLCSFLLRFLRKLNFYTLI
jgi:hypothetical protein